MNIPFFFYTLLNIVSLCIEIALGIYLLLKILGIKEIAYIKLKTGIYYVVYLSCILIQEYYPFSFDCFPLYLIFHSLFLILYGLLFCEGRIAFKLFLPLTYVALLTQCLFPTQILLLLLKNIVWDLPSNGILFLVISFMFHLLIVLFILRFKPDTSERYPFSFYISMIVTPILNMTMIILLKPYYLVIHTIIIIGFLSLLVQLLIYYTNWKGTIEYSKRVNLQLMQQQKEYQIQHQNELSVIVDNYHQLRHDMKNHCLVMEQLLVQKNYDTLHSYFTTLNDNMNSFDQQIESGNEVVNQVLNIKYTIAKQLCIPLEIEATLPSKINIPDYHICSLLANLLDNAIEASQKVENPFIQIKIELIKSYFSITVRNRIHTHQANCNIMKKSSKKNPELHGYGLRIIENIADKYDGIVSFRIVEDTYIASVMCHLVEPMEANPK